MEAYLIIKSLHVISVISWMAGLLYLPRIFVYHAENQKTENMSMISKYTKENIMMYFNNLLCKLNSISLDESEFERYKNDIDNILEKFKLKDVELINSYGNINSIKELFKVNNINYDITKFYNLNSLDIFNLLYDISLQYDLKI